MSLCRRVFAVSSPARLTNPGALPTVAAQDSASSRPGGQSMRRRQFLMATTRAAPPPRGRSTVRRAVLLGAVPGRAAAATVRPARAADPIRIGYFGPLTGNFSQTGKDMNHGFTLFWGEGGNTVAGREVE